MTRTLVDEPDLASLPGYDPTWAPSSDRKFAADTTCVQPPAAFLDGTMVRTSTRSMN